MRIGMGIQNIGSQVQFIEREGRMPAVFRVGTSFQFMQTAEHHLVGSFEFSHPPDNAERLNVGAEYGFRDFIFVRGGLQLQLRRRGPGGGGGAALPGEHAAHRGQRGLRLHRHDGPRRGAPRVAAPALLGGGRSGPATAAGAATTSDGGRPREGARRAVLGRRGAAAAACRRPRPALPRRGILVPSARSASRPLRRAAGARPPRGGRRSWPSPASAVLAPGARQARPRATRAASPG